MSLRSISYSPLAFSMGFEKTRKDRRRELEDSQVGCTIVNVRALLLSNPFVFSLMSRYLPIAKEWLERYTVDAAKCIIEATAVLSQLLNPLATRFDSKLKR